MRIPPCWTRGLVAALQRLIHFEIAAFGCARTHAKVLGETAA